MINRHKNEDKTPVKWLKIKWMRFTKDSLVMEYKEGLDDMYPIMACDMCRIRRKREEALQYVKAFQPGLAFNDETRKISFEKYTDLSKLLDYIPPIHHGLCSGLSHHT